MLPLLKIKVDMFFLNICRTLLIAIDNFLIALDNISCEGGS